MSKVAFAPEFVLPLPETHRFPMEKYQLIPEQLLYEGIYEESDFFRPSPVSPSTIKLTHTRGYTQQLLNRNLDKEAVRRIGFPLSEQLIERELLITGGTIELCYYAMREGVGLNVAGGTHHAGPDYGEGFCLLNDVAVAANYLLQQGEASQILIIDLDVHQGNGTAQIFQNAPCVTTFSMHGENNFPLEKPPSDYDIALPDQTSDRAYLHLLKAQLPDVLERTSPDFLFYIAGADILSTDRLGRLAVSLQGCRERDAFVLKTAQQAGIPLVITMGGGYSAQVRHIVDAHCQTFRWAQTLFGR